MAILPNNNRTLQKGMNILRKRIMANIIFGAQLHNIQELNPYN